MSRQMENDLAQVRSDLQELKQQSAAAFNALVERIEMLEGHNNAVVEGDDIEPKAARNGKLRRSR